MQEPQITIIVVPRERFSCARASLESIYEYTTIPFNLVYVDGNSPPKIKRYLHEQAQAKNFQLIRTNYYLSPNHARNLGLTHVNTKYLVFIDNDVIVSPGWLEALINCAEETEATVVGPLMCQNEPIHEIVHFAGGESHIILDKTGRRRIREKMYKQGQKVAEVLPKLQRTPTQLAEFHCVLVRTEIFEKIGKLDEAMFNTKEHLDFCMIVAETGGKIYFEPACVVTYVPGPPLEWSDLHFYMLRWSNAWTLASLDRLREKWNLAEDGYFQTKYKGLGWRRRDAIIRPLAQRLTFGFKSHLLEMILLDIDNILNHYLTTRYASQQRQRLQQQSPSSVELPSASTTALSNQSGKA